MHHVDTMHPLTKTATFQSSCGNEGRRKEINKCILTRVQNQKKMCKVTKHLLSTPHARNGLNEDGNQHPMFKKFLSDYENEATKQKNKL